MTIQKLVDSFRIFDGVYKRDEIEEALTKKEEIIPCLIEVLEDVCSAPEEYAEREDHFGHIYALMLLGHFKESRAHEVIVKLLSLPGELPFQLFGDTVTEDAPIILLSTCGGDFEEIKKLALNQEANEFCRGAALEAIAYGVVAKALEREDAIRFYEEALENRKSELPSHFHNDLACCILDLYPEELLELVRQAYEDGYIDSGYVGFHSFEETLNKGKEKCLEKLHLEMEGRSLEDLHQRMSWWACFDQENRNEPITVKNVPRKEKSKESKQKKKKQQQAKASKRKNRKKKKKK
jgi:hypothetical protein